MSGRKRGLAYQLYNFIPKVLNGKHAAICRCCNKILKNTAATRLHKHRKICALQKIRQNVTSCATKNKLAVKRTGTSNEIDAEIGMYNNDRNENSNIEIDCKEAVPLADVKIEHNGDNLNQIEDNFYNINDNYPSDSMKFSFEKSVTILATTVEESGSELQELEGKTTESYETDNTHNGESVHNDNDNEVIMGNVSPNVADIVNHDDVDIDDKYNDNDEMMANNAKKQERLKQQLLYLDIEYCRKKADFYSQLSEQCNIKKELMLLKVQKLQLEMQINSRKLS